MRSSLSQRFQHFLCNKPAKVEKQPEIFSDSFHTLSNIFQQRILIDSWTFNSYYMWSCIVKREAESIASTEA